MKSLLRTNIHFCSELFAVDGIYGCNDSTRAFEFALLAQCLEYCRFLFIAFEMTLVY